MMTYEAPSFSDLWGFSADPVLRHPIGSKYAYVNETFYFVDRDGIKHYVLKGAKTDGASIPRLLWRILGHPMSSQYLAAAIVHDCKYASIRDLPKAERAAARLRADRLFGEMLQFLQVGLSKRVLMYGAVRGFGRWATRNILRIGPS